MAFDLPPLRIALYFTLAIFSLILLGLTGSRLQYTEHLPRGDPLNGGRDFYDPIVVELLFTTLLSMAWSIFLIHTIHRRLELKYVSTFRSELIGLIVLWLFWLIGAAIASSIWGNLSFCQQFHACRLLTALVAFSWLGWIVVSLLLGLSVMFVIANGAANEPMHGRYDPRLSSFRTSQGTYPSAPNTRPHSAA